MSDIGWLSHHLTRVRRTRNELFVYVIAPAGQQSDYSILCDINLFFDFMICSRTSLPFSHSILRLICSFLLALGMYIPLF